jgi:hypothetical protein
MKSPKVKWLSEPEAHDYKAAESYLSLLFVGASPKELRDVVSKLRKAKVVSFKAKDIFRASGLPLLSVENHYVAKDRKRIRTGKKLSPLLLWRQPERLCIADGYHRMCAVYSVSEDVNIPCKIV